MVKKEIQNLCIKSLAGNCDENEEKILNSWLAVSEENRREFNYVKEIWNKSSLPGADEMFDVDEEWTMLSERIYEKENGVVAKKAILWKKPVFKVVWKPALGLVAVLILLLYITDFYHQSQSTKNILVATANKEHKLVKFSDGTTALLNSQSSLNYPEEFSGKVRMVSLSGEAFFSVAKNGRPFIINTPNATTTVLGTKFDVWAREEKTRVIVRDGLVNLAVKNTSDGVTITKNQLSVVVNNSRPTKPQTVESSYLLGWINKKLVFNKTPLGEVVNELEGFYDVKLILANEKLKILTLSGSIESSCIDTALSMICLALDLKYEKMKADYVIKPKLNDK